MIEVGPLSIFGKHYVAAWHWPWSLTWRWIFSVKRHDKNCRLGTYWTRSLRGINTPLIDVALHLQQNMRRDVIKEWIFWHIKDVDYDGSD